MTASSLLLILIGVFILINSSNFVKVLQGQAKIGFSGTKGTSQDDTLGGTSSGRT